MQNENIVLRVLNKLAEPFDRRIALAAMAAVVSTMNADDNGDFAGSSDGAKRVPVVGAATNLMPPNGRWFKSVSSPERAFCLYFRIAHKSTVVSFSSYLCFNPPTLIQCSIPHVY